MYQRALPVLLAALMTSCVAGLPPLVTPPDFAPNVPIAAVGVYTDGIGKCSAVAIEPTLALTAEHCLAGISERFDRVFTYMGLDGAGEARVVSRHVLRVEFDPKDGADIAVLQIDPATPFPEWATIATDLPEGGELLTIVGWGCMDGQPAVRPAVYSFISGGMLNFYGSLCFGDSGGGLFNADGELLGIHARKSSDGRFGASTLAGMALALLERFDQ